MNAAPSNSTNNLPSRPRRRGFTLIEVLVASGITVLLVGFMVAIVSNVTGFWSRTSGRLSAESQARYALDQLTLDLQSAIYRDDGATWLAASVPNNTATSSSVWVTTGAVIGNLKPSTAIGTTNPALTYGAANIANATFGPAGTWLRFFTTLSAPVAVGWQLIRRASATNTANIDRRYFLHRAEVTPANTLNTGFDITLPAYAGTAAASGNSGTLGTARSVRIPIDVGTIIAENVIDFGVYLYTRPAVGAMSSAPLRVFPNGTERTHLANRPPRSGAQIDEFPEEAEIMIRVLTDEGAAQIAAFETGRLTLPAGRSAAQYWWDIAVAKSQVFTRRIVLRAQPL
jgi:prepilin-type N-terminal cleavage/methylation domain-containing protein